jgi:hypothetical protein
MCLYCYQDSVAGDIQNLVGLQRHCIHSGSPLLIRIIDYIHNGRLQYSQLGSVSIIIKLVIASESVT